MPAFSFLPVWAGRCAVAGLGLLGLPAAGQNQARPPARRYCRDASHAASAELHLQLAEPGHLTFALKAAYGAHTGDLEGTLRQQKPGVYRYQQGGCGLTFQVGVAGTVRVTEAGDCGAAEGVTYAGTYRRCPAPGARPAPAPATLRSLGILPDAALDAQLRQQAGPVYADFVASAVQVERLDSLAPAGPCTLVRCWVPGVADSMHSLLLLAGRQYWAATVADEKILYFTNAAPGAAAIPAAFGRWAAARHRPIEVR